MFTSLFSGWLLLSLGSPHIHPKSKVQLPKRPFSGSWLARLPQSGDPVGHFGVSNTRRGAGQAQSRKLFFLRTHPLWKLSRRHANAKRNGIIGIGARKLVAHKVTCMLTATGSLTVSVTRGTA